jgi:hypothetical protein
MCLKQVKTMTFFEGQMVCGEVDRFDCTLCVVTWLAKRYNEPKETWQLSTGRNAPS